MSDKSSNVPVDHPSGQRRPKIFSLTGEVGIRDAAGIYRELCDLIDAGGEAQIDVANLTGLDTSIAQLLLAAARSAAERGSKLQFTGISESPLPRFMATIGLDRIADDEVGDVQGLLATANVLGEGK